MNQITLTSEHRIYRPNYQFWTSVVNAIPLEKMAKWMYKNCDGDIVIGHTFIYFQNETDAVLFKLSFKQPEII